MSAAQEAGDRFGHALALADVDGDGLADLAAGAPGEDLVGIGSDAGLVTVWFGKAGADATDAFSAGVRVDQTDAGAAEEPGDRYGSALASVGGDNLFRLAASAPDETVGSNQSGNVIAFETVTPAEVSGTSLAPVADPLGAFDTGDRFGASLALGDLNGDGWLDLAAGAPGASQGAGRVTVFQGHPTGLQAGQSVNQSALVGGNEAGDLLGASLAAGDFDGDGAADLAIGAPGEAPFASPTSGLVTVVAGALSLPHVSHGPFLGGISDTSVHVWIRGSQPAPWRVELWPSAAPSQVQTQTGPALAQASDFTGRVVASGLTPDTAYSYRVVFDGDVGATTSFRTLPAAGSASQIRFLFAADFHVNLKPFSIFETMAGLAPDFIIMGGDNIYADSPNTVPDTPEGYFGRYRATFGDGRLSDALASTPVFMTWDDHEIINDFYPTKSPRYPSARAGFDAYQAVHNPAPAVAGELYYAFQAGPADFFVLDTRTHRDANTEPDGPTKTMLGLTQRQALLSWLDTSTATFKVIVSSVPFSDWSTTKSDSWNGFDNAGKNFSSERALIFNHIDTNDISGVLLVSGDQHWSGVFQHTAGSTTLHEFMPTPAAIGNRALPAGITTAPDVLHASDSHRVFGRFDLDDSGASPTAHFRLVSDSGQVLYSLVLSASDLGL